MLNNLPAAGDVHECISESEDAEEKLLRSSGAASFPNTTKQAKRTMTFEPLKALHFVPAVTQTAERELVESVR